LSTIRPGKEKSILWVYEPSKLSVLYASAFLLLRSTTKPQMPIAAPKGKLIDGTAKIDATMVSVLAPSLKVQ
jgi:hypothetical protein